MSIFHERPAGADQGTREMAPLYADDFGYDNPVTDERSVLRPGMIFTRRRGKVADEAKYRTLNGHHTLFVTLEGGMASSVRHDSAGWDSRPDRPGSLSFTPAGRDRTSLLGTGQARWAVVKINQDVMDGACGTEGPYSWRTLVNDSSPKLLQNAWVLNAAVDAEAPSIVIDTLLIALARTLGSHLGGIELRHDDAWMNPGALRRVIERIEAAPEEDHSLVDLAGEAGLGASAFLRAFRGATGATPGAYLIDRRLHRASDLLAASDLPVAEIGRSVGFGSAAHFANMFSRRYGMSPSKFRKERMQDPTTANYSVS